MNRALAFVAFVLLVACVTLAIGLRQARREVDALEDGAGVLREDIRRARARVETLTASVAEAEAVARHAEARAAQVRVEVRERVRYVRVRAEQILSEPPSEAGAQASMHRLADFRGRP